MRKNRASIFDIRRFVPLLFAGLIISVTPALAQSNDDDDEDERPAPADTRPQTPPAERPSLRRRPAPAPAPAPAPPRQPAPAREGGRENAYRAPAGNFRGLAAF